MRALEKVSDLLLEVVCLIDTLLLIMLRKLMKRNSWPEASRLVTEDFVAHIGFAKCSIWGEIMSSGLYPGTASISCDCLRRAALADDRQLFLTNSSEYEGVVKRKGDIIAQC